MTASTSPLTAVSQSRVLTVAPMPPEKLAYALARYSRSADSIRDSLAWVKTHDSSKFLESFYFQYGHASIADLGHLAVCFEGISELAATEIEDEQLWDGQARSSRYQNFSKSAAIVPPDLTADQKSIYSAAAAELLNAYSRVHARTLEYLREIHSCPEGMKPEAYERNLAARAFDVARYLLPFGIPTGVGQVTSIRTLERQIRRLQSSPWQELREIAEELKQACTAPAACAWSSDDSKEPIAPTLARHGDADEFSPRMRSDLALWAQQNLPPIAAGEQPAVTLIQPGDHVADLCATLLYPVTQIPYRSLYEHVCEWSASKRRELIDLALSSRQRRDELPRQFRSSPFVFDVVMDIGAYRDLHRHRRCQQFRQEYTNQLGYERPDILDACGAASHYDDALSTVHQQITRLPQPASQYLLPFAARSRFLFKMDFAELEYISRLRSGVKGHFSYRKIAWEMKVALDAIDPLLGSLVKATPPWVEDALQR